ncbi:PE-PPE domain-containing protein [Mycobacterium sp. B14F4]|uniref:PE-PPE domain-containing protein n=1 Tax=Mycobacterium sp. B14F4 TaxID=3153565 RepID=UPI00325EB0C8
MRKFGNQPRFESARAKRRSAAKGNKAKKLGLLGAASATAVAVAFASPMANALSSETYFVGIPSWLPISGVQTLPSDPDVIKNAIVAAKDSDPLIAWGLDPVDLVPAWVVWPDGLPSYTLPVIGQTGSHVETNPLYQPAYDAAYDVAYAAGYAQKLADLVQQVYDTTFSTVRATRYTEILNSYPWYLRNLQVTKDAAMAQATAEATAAAISAANAARTNPTYVSQAEAAGVIAGEAAALEAVANIPQTITVPDFGITEDGYWTTTTAGQWVSPTDLEGLPLEVQLAYAAWAIQNGDIGVTAPLLNWTTYLTNVNLIAYGDGAIATGQAYQAFIDAVKNGEIQAGQPLTGPRQIRIVDENGVVRLVTVYVTNNPLDVPSLTFPPATDQPEVEVVQPGGVIDATLLSLVLLRNPGRPNGGLYARFSDQYVTPERQDVLPEGVDPELVAKLINGDFSDVDSIDELLAVVDQLEAADGQPIVLTLKADAGWEYDLLSDAPATANPFAWANSLASAIFLTNLITGIDPANPTTAPEGTTVNWYVVPAGQPDAGTIYVTYAPNQLALLAPLRLPTQLLSLVTGQSINNPVADAFEPALKMLVNLGYTDVVRNPDGTYSRTLNQMHMPTPFGSKAPLTPQMLLYVPGDFITLLGKGIGDELSQELEQIVRLVLSIVAPNAPLDPGVVQLLRAPGDMITAVSKGVGDATSAALTGVGKPAIEANPGAAAAVSTVVQGALPPQPQPEPVVQDQQPVQTMLDDSVEPAAVAESPAPVESDPPADTTDDNGPRLNVVTGTGNSATAPDNDDTVESDAEGSSEETQEASVVGGGTDDPDTGGDSGAGDAGAGGSGGDGSGQ